MRRIAIRGGHSGVIETYSGQTSGHSSLRIGHALAPMAQLPIEESWLVTSMPSRPPR